MLSTLRADSVGQSQSGRNAAHAIGMVQAADVALGQMESGLTDALALAEQMARGGYNEARQTIMQAELDGLLNAIDTLSESVDFDGTNLLTAGGQTVVSLAHVGST